MCPFLWLSIFYCIYVPQFLYPFTANGHLVCFYVLVLVNSAAMNTGAYVSFLDFGFLQDICLGVGLLGYMEVLFLVF